MDNLDKIVISISDLVSSDDFKNETPEMIANEIRNRIECFNMSDRENEPDNQTGVRDNFFRIIDVFNALKYDC